MSTLGTPVDFQSQFPLLGELFTVLHDHGSSQGTSSFTGSAGGRDSYRETYVSRTSGIGRRSNGFPRTLNTEFQNLKIHDINVTDLSLIKSFFGKE